MTKIEKFCDCCGDRQEPDSTFDTITLTIAGVYTTWDLCINCARTFFRQIEEKFEFTRGRRREEKVIEMEPGESLRVPG